MNSSRLINTKKNIIFSFLLQFTKLLTVFVNRIIFVKILGASYLGVNGLFSNILGILSLADLGMTTVLMYSLYKPLAEDDKELIYKYINFFKKIYNYIAIVVTLFGILLIPFLKYLVNLPETINNIYLYYILLLLNTSVTYLFVYKTTVVSADQKMYVLNKYDTVFQYLLFFLQIFVLLLTKSFALYLFVNLAITFISNLFKVRKTLKMYPYLSKKSNLQLDKSKKKKIVSDLKSLFLYKIGSVIQSNTDNIFISIFSGTIMVGFYSNYLTIINGIVGFITKAFTSIKASIGNLVTNEKISKQLELFNIFELYNFFLICFCSICFIVLIPDFINLCFGEKFVLNSSILIATVLNFYTSNIRQNIWAYRETTGIFSKTKFVTLVTSVLNILFSIFLGKLYGIFGVIIATVISRFLYAWWKEPLILFNDYFKVKPIKYFVDYCVRILLCSLLCLLFYFVTSFIVLESLLLVLIIKSLICLIFIPIILLFLYRNHVGIYYLKNNVLKNFLEKR